VTSIGGKYVPAGKTEAGALAKQADLRGKAARGERVVLPSKLPFPDLAEQWYETKAAEARASGPFVLSSCEHERTELCVRQTRIFVPPRHPFDGCEWAETLLGSVVTPLVRDHPPEWFWFSRYVQPPEGDVGDCVISEIPDAFAFEDQHSRSLRLRYALRSTDREAFETRGRSLIEAAGARISDFRDYPWVADLGGDRFLGAEGRTDERRQKRADAVVAYLTAVSRLTLEYVLGPDQNMRYRLEVGDSNHNPHGSSFESLHHLFCNITNVQAFGYVRDTAGNVHEIPVAC
jgi:hypothetical protein